jgi:hypothetical protein
VSANASNSLSPVTTELAAKLADELLVTAYVRGSGLLREQISTLLSRLQRASDHILIQWVDPVTQPGLARNAGITREGTLVLEYRSRRVTADNASEQSLANAIASVIRPRERWVVGLVGHGERALNGKANHELGELAQALERTGFRARELGLGDAGSIPTNAEVVLLSEPESAFLEHEKRAVLEYLERGGNALVLLEPGRNRLSWLTRHLDIAPAGPALTIEHQGQLRQLPASVVVIQRYPRHPISTNFNRITLFPGMSEITRSEGSSESSWTWQPLILAPESTPDTNRRPLAVALTRRRSDGGQQRVLVFGDGDFASNAYLTNGSNLELATRAMSWLGEDDNLVEIPPRIAIDRNLDLNPGIIQAIAIAALFGLPALMLLVGLARWIRNRGD